VINEANKKEENEPSAESEPNDTSKEASVEPEKEPLKEAVEVVSNKADVDEKVEEEAEKEEEAKVVKKPPPLASTTLGSKPFDRSNFEPDEEKKAADLAKRAEREKAADEKKAN
jgi:hypothetical protein